MNDQRRGPDFIIKVIRWSSIISWIILIVIEGIFVVLNPSFSPVTWDRTPESNISQGWIVFLYTVFILLLLINISGIIFNIYRLKRKTDRIRVTFIVSIIASIAGLVMISIMK